MAAVIALDLKFDPL
jgi:hypothetical protein